MSSKRSGRFFLYKVTFCYTLLKGMKEDIKVYKNEKNHFDKKRFETTENNKISMKEFNSII